MHSFRTIAIPTSTAEAVRTTLKSPGYGHPAHIEVATGHGPCRHCLQTFKVGAERRILFTHDSFSEVEELPLPGPVYIHQTACQRFLASDGFPEDLRSHSLTLSAYTRGRELKANEYVNDGDPEAAIKRLFARPEVDYILVCDTEAGCFDFRLERAEL